MSDDEEDSQEARPLKNNKRVAHRVKRNSTANGSGSGKKKKVAVNGNVEEAVQGEQGMKTDSSLFSKSA